MTNNPTRSLGALLITLTIGLFACAEPHENPKQSKSFDYKNLALRLIATNKLAQASTNCLTLEQESEADSQFVEFYIREKHDSKCPGDPSSAPLLFTIRIDRNSHSATTDANSDTGDFEEIK